MDTEVFQLISCWSEEGIQEQLEGCKRNKHIYERLSKLLAEHNIEKTGEQCRTKVKKLRQEYKKIKDSKKQTGGGRIEWKYFEKLDEILAARPATHPPVLLETLKPATVESDSDATDAEGQDDNNISLVDLHSQVNATTDDGDSEHLSGSSTDSVSGTPPSDHSGSSTRDATEDIVKKDKAGIKGKKRKRSKGEMLEDVMTKAMKVMTDGLRDSDRMFTELEEKRLKFEEQQRREEREFQLRMIQMMQSAHGTGSSSFYSPYSHGSSPPYYGPPEDY